jgi:hypothetical protein
MLTVLDVSRNQLRELPEALGGVHSVPGARHIIHRRPRENRRPGPALFEYLEGLLIN